MGSICIRKNALLETLAPPRHPATRRARSFSKASLYVGHGEHRGPIRIIPQAGTGTIVLSTGGNSAGPARDHNVPQKRPTWPSFLSGSNDTKQSSARPGQAIRHGRQRNSPTSVGSIRSTTGSSPAATIGGLKRQELRGQRRSGFRQASANPS